MSHNQYRSTYCDKIGPYPSVFYFPENCVKDANVNKSCMELPGFIHKDSL